MNQPTCIMTKCQNVKNVNFLKKIRLRSSTITCKEVANSRSSRSCQSSGSDSEEKFKNITYKTCKNRKKTIQNTNKTEKTSHISYVNIEVHKLLILG